MMTEESLPYEGRCIDGPLKGQWIISESLEFKAAMAAPWSFKELMELDPDVVADRSIESITYRWVDWSPSDAGVEVKAWKCGRR